MIKSFSNNLDAKKRREGRQSLSNVAQLVLSLLQIDFEWHVPAIKVQNPGENLVLAHHGVILLHDDALDSFNRLHVLTP